MSMPARVALLLLLALGFVRLSAAETDELAALRAKAERGNALAQYNLGLVYVPADLPEAFAWLSLASESGATGKALDSLLGKISDEQLAEGRRRLGTYRTALAAKNATAATARNGTPKLSPRGFTLEAPTPTPPPSDPRVPVTKAPEAVSGPINTSPADGSGLSELAQTRKELEKTRADLLAANAEITTLRASVARLEAAAAEAKPVALPAPVEKPKAEDPPPHRP